VLFEERHDLAQCQPSASASAAQRSAAQRSRTLSAVLGGICVADRTAAVVNSADGRSSGAAELFDALYCRLFVHAYECLAQLAGDVEDFSAALVMVRPLLGSRCADLHSAYRSVGEAHATRIAAGRELERRMFAMSALLQLVRRTIGNRLCSMHVCACAHACATVRVWCFAEVELRSASSVQQVEWDLYGALAQAPENIDVRTRPHGCDSSRLSSAVLT
jgi:hypothetical protein